MTYDRSAWKQANTKEVELSEGRVAVIRPLPADAIVKLADLPITAAVVRDVHDKQDAPADRAPVREMLVLMKDVIMGGCVLPKFVTDASVELSEDQVYYHDLPLLDAMTLFREIMSFSKLDAEELAQARQFRQE